MNALKDIALGALLLVPLAACEASRHSAGPHEEMEEEEGEENEQGEHANVQVPEAVRQTADRLTPPGAARTYGSELEDGETRYEVEYAVQGVKSSALIAAQGALIELEREIQPSALPEAVRAAALKQHAGAQIVSAEALETFGYELVVEVGGKKTAVAVGASGRIEIPPAASKEADEEEEEEEEADEKPGAPDAVPPAVTQAAERVAGASSKRTITAEHEDGELRYEVEFSEAGAAATAVLGAGGELLELERAVEPSALPLAIREAVARAYKGSKILSAESVERHAYEVHLRSGNKALAIEFSPTGQPR